MNKMIKLGITSVLVAASMFTFAQEDTFSNKEGSEYKFTMIKEIRVELERVGVFHHSHFLNLN